MKMKLILTLALLGFIHGKAFASISSPSLLMSSKIENGPEMVNVNGEVSLNQIFDDDWDDDDWDDDDHHVGVSCVAIKRVPGYFVRRFVGHGITFNRACRRALKHCERSFPPYAPCVVLGEGH
jgi:hypothetical protein